MIAVLGNPEESMVSGVYAQLRGRGRNAVLIPTADLPGSIRLGLSLADGGGFFVLADGRRVGMGDVRSIYQRVGFYDFEVYQEYSADEARFVNSECITLMNALLNNARALVINRPIVSGSNASKPYQITLVERHGFKVPKTLVTNRPSLAEEFYDRLHGDVVYKSISYLRSIVQVMQPEDLERLDTLQNCPIQLQERVVGQDIRVHVVGDRALFASIISAEKSDYRYDREAEIVPHQLPPEIEERCFAVTRALGFVLSGIDLRVTPDGDYYCFEVNPSPAFTWYEQRTSQPITAALCDVLEAAD